MWRRRTVKPPGPGTKQGGGESGTTQELVDCWVTAPARARPRRSEVADRWHLFHNLTKAVDKAIRGHRQCLVDPVSEPEQRPQPLPPQAATAAEPGLREDNTRSRHRQVHALLAEDVSINAISKKLTLDRKTVRRYARAETADELLTASTTRRKNLDDHVPWTHYRRGDIAGFGCGCGGGDRGLW